MQQSSFVGVLLARHVSGDFAHHQKRGPVLQDVVFCTVKYTPLQIQNTTLRLQRGILDSMQNKQASLRGTN
jgi:hypothetical protein